MTNDQHREPDGHLRTTKRGPDGLTHATPVPQTTIANPCPVCGNSAHLQETWRPELGFDRRMRQFKCLQGHEHYTIPRHSRTVLQPPQ